MRPSWTCRTVVWAAVLLYAVPVQAGLRLDQALDLARKGWVYELRETMLGRDLSIPVRIHPDVNRGATLCLLGEPPTPQSRQVIDAFLRLLRDSFGTAPDVVEARTIDGCDTDRPVALRLYSGRPPNDALTADLTWLSARHGLGLPRGRRFLAVSPAQGQTFFGPRGAVTHIMVQQSSGRDRSPLADTFFRSILIEELYQSFTFGMDILHFDPSVPWASKLEENPTLLRNMPWDSDRFRMGLLASNPVGLCPFDLMMLAALADAPVETSTDPALLDHIAARFDALTARVAEQLDDPRNASILDASCTGIADAD